MLALFVSFLKYSLTSQFLKLELVGRQYQNVLALFYLCQFALADLECHFIGCISVSRMGFGNRQPSHQRDLPQAIGPTRAGSSPRMSLSTLSRFRQPQVSYNQPSCMSIQNLTCNNSLRVTKNVQIIQAFIFLLQLQNG